MTTTSIAQRALSNLVIIDVQQRLAKVMQAEAMQSVLNNSRILVKAAAILEVPVIFTEQYPQGLGHTVPELTALLDSKNRVEKTAFSCCNEPLFNRKLIGDKPHIILAGMEAHICVLQTALQLQTQGKQVFVVEDAVLSRNPLNRNNAIARMRQAGVIITNTESVVFEWLGDAQGDAFKQISALIR